MVKNLSKNLQKLFICTLYHVAITLALPSVTIIEENAYSKQTLEKSNFTHYDEQLHEFFNITDDFLNLQKYQHFFNSKYCHNKWGRCLLLSIILGLIIVSTVIGNGFVIAAVVLEKNLHNVANHLIVSLAVADLMVAVMVMPIAAYQEIVTNWTFGNLLCDMWTSFDVLCCTASILHLVAIAFDRYLAITKVDYAAKRTGSRIMTMIAIIWFLATTISILPHIFGLSYNNTPRCRLTTNLLYQVFSTLGAFYLPLFVMCVIYWKIFQSAKFRIRKRAFQRPNTTTNANGTLRMSLNRKSSSDMGKPCGKSSESSKIKSHHRNLSSEALSHAIKSSASDEHLNIHSSKHCISDHDATTDCHSSPLTTENAPKIAKKPSIFHSIFRDIIFLHKLTKKNLTIKKEIIDHEANIKLPHEISGINNSESMTPRSIVNKNSESFSFKEVASKEDNLEKTSSNSTSMNCKRNWRSFKSAATQSLDLSKKQFEDLNEMQQIRRAYSSKDTFLDGDNVEEMYKEVKLNYGVPIAASESDIINSSVATLDINSCRSYRRKNFRDFNGVSILISENDSSPSSIDYPCIANGKKSFKAKSMKERNVTKTPVAKIVSSVSFQSKDSNQTCKSLNFCSLRKRASEEMNGSDEAKSAKPLMNMLSHPIELTTISSVNELCSSNGCMVKPIIREETANTNTQITEYSLSENTTSRVETSMKLPEIPKSPTMSTQVNIKSPNVLNVSGAKKRKIDIKRERKAAKTLGIIMSCFTMCWLPFFIMQILFALCTSCNESVGDHPIVTFISWLGYLNSTLNPIIYTIFSPDFREAFAKILIGKYRKPKSSSSAVRNNKKMTF